MNPMQRTASEREANIDAALHHLSTVQPVPGIEQRIHIRLAHARENSASDTTGFFPTLRHFFHMQRLPVATAAAMLGCAAIVIGSVQHSHQQRTLPIPGVHLAAPGFGQGAGLGAASGTHLSSQPIAAPQHGRARSERKAAHGRATIAKDVQKPAGVGIPESPRQP